MKQVNCEREKQEDAERWVEYQRSGKSISHEIAAAWLENLAKGKSASRPQ